MDLSAVARRYFDERMVHFMGPLDGLAEWLKQTGHPAAAYFRFLRERYGSHPAMVSPKKLINSKKIFDHFIDERSRELEYFQLDAVLDFESFQARVRRGKEPQTLLEDESLELSPVFRWAMATTLGFYGVAIKWRDRAKESLHEHPERVRAYQGKMREAVELLLEVENEAN